MDLGFSLFFFLLFLPSSFPTHFELHRISSKEMSISQLKLQDQHRHLQFNGISFPLLGSYDANSFGFYFTTVKIGSPPREYNLVVDTGSQISWVSCYNCTSCPTYNAFGMSLDYYDPRSSTSASMIYCSNRACKSFSHPNCSSPASECPYKMQYMEGSTSTGHLVSDIFHLDLVNGSSVTTRTASIIFGCTDYWSRCLNYPYTFVDGILALGAGDISLISQLSSQRAAPMMFAHCLRGEGNGGGNLIIGEIQAHDLMYTPINTSRQLYAVNMQGIAVNGQILPIDPAVFALSDYGGTLVDSGTSLVVLAEKAYDALVHFLTVGASQSARPVLIDGNLCFKVSSRIDEIFPTVSFIFEGGASMILKPRDYLLLLAHFEGVQTWCTGFLKAEGKNLTVLGELVLKNKIIVYDLARQRLGWTNYNCSHIVNVSVSAHGSANSLLVDSVFKSILTNIIALFIYICMFG